MNTPEGIPRQLRQAEADDDLTRRAQETQLLCTILGAIRADVLTFEAHPDVERLRLALFRRLAELAGVEFGATTG